MRRVVDFVFKIDDKASAVTDKVTKGFDNLFNTTNKVQSACDRLGASFLKLNAIRSVVDSANQALGTLSDPFIKYESALAEVQAITGIAGKALDDIGEKGRRLAVTFGSNAADSIGLFTSVLSRLGPDIAKSDVALMGMGEHIMTLSKSMKGDVTGSMDALTTAMLQYGVDLSDPIRATDVMGTQMNIMAAGAKVGSAMVTQVSQSLKVAGSAAASADVSFAEFNAATQVLGKGALYGAEAGTALRNILSTLQMGRFLPKDVQEELKNAGVNINALSDKTKPLSERLGELQKVQKDAALLSKLFGKESAGAANLLLGNISTLREWTGAIKGSNEAQEQAQIVMATTAEKMAIMKAYFSDLAISFGSSTKDFLPAIQVAAGGFTLFYQVKPVFDFLGSLTKSAILTTYSLAKATAVLGLSALKTGAAWAWSGSVGLSQYVTGLLRASVAQRVLNIAMATGPFVVLTAGIAAASFAIYGLIKHWDVVKEWLIGLGKFFVKYNPFSMLMNGLFELFPALKTTLNDWWESITGFFKKIYDSVKEVVMGIKQVLGFGEEINALAGNTPKSVLDDVFFSGNKTETAASKTESLDAKLYTNANSIASGGTKTTHVNITIGKMIESFVVNSASVEKGVDDIEQKIKEVLLRALNGANQMA